MTKVILNNAVQKIAGGSIDIETFLKMKNNWVEVFYHVIDIYNITPKYYTKRSPNQLHFGLSNEVEIMNVMNDADKRILEATRKV
jgi:hypothetical protein